MTTINATVGEPYIVTRHGSLIRLERQVYGRNVRHVFAAADALAVADALVDAAEQMA